MNNNYGVIAFSEYVGEQFFEYFYQFDNLIEFQNYVDNLPYANTNIYVHGVCNSFIGTMFSAFKIYKNDAYNSNIFFFSWPSRRPWPDFDVLCFKNYTKDRYQSEESFPLFSSFLNDFSEFKISNIHILAHSRGSYVALRTINEGSYNNNVNILSLSLASPDVVGINYLHLVKSRNFNIIPLQSIYFNADDWATWASAFVSGSDTINTPESGYKRADFIRVDDVNDLLGHSLHVNSSLFRMDYQEARSTMVRAARRHNVRKLEGYDGNVFRLSSE